MIYKLQWKTLRFEFNISRHVHFLDNCKTVVGLAVRVDVMFTQSLFTDPTKLVANSLISLFRYLYKGKARQGPQLAQKLKVKKKINWKKWGGVLKMLIHLIVCLANSQILYIEKNDLHVIVLQCHTWTSTRKSFDV